jgi:DNA-binding MarR family transcriptional regulator
MLVVISYRCTIVGDWVLREADLKRIVKSGLGKNVARRAISELNEIELIHRRQEPGLHVGTFGRAREDLNLPPCSKSDSQIVWRAWFDGTLTMKELAALIYLRAGSGKGRQGTYARELVKRFEWSRPSASKIITALLERDLLEKVEKRDNNGMFAGTTYRVSPLAADKLERSTRTTVKKPGNGMPVYGPPDNGSAG